MKSGRLFGAELEVTGGAQALADVMYDRGLLHSPDRCNYHCRCEHCRHEADRPNPWTFQEDSTVDGEFITKPLAWGSAEAAAALDGMAASMLEARPVLDQSDKSAGNHVHVSLAGYTWADLLRLYRLVVRHQDHLGLLARGKNGYVRHYNTPAAATAHLWRVDARPLQQCALVAPAPCGGVRYGGSWLRWSSYGTMEFRLWNSTSAGWRLRLHSGLSVAMVNAAKRRNVKEDDPRSFTEVVGPYMDDRTFAYYARQLHRVGGIAA